jgi:hypothetical protein
MTKPTGHQVDRLYERLSAKERAKLRLGWWKEYRDDDPALRKATPDDQLDEVDRYIRAAMECHDVVTTFVLQLSEKVETVQARMAMIACFHLWMLDAYRLRWAAEWDLPEVITESEHATRLAERREERFPLEDCSHLLADIDLEDDEMEADRVQWEQRIRHALRAKQLKATKDGIRYGDLMDWAGEEVSVYAQRGHKLAVLPDDQARNSASTNAGSGCVQTRRAGRKVRFGTPIRAERFVLGFARGVPPGVGPSSLPFTQPTFGRPRV